MKYRCCSSLIDAINDEEVAEIEADSPGEAAEIFAEKDDWDSASYSYAKGDCEIVVVQGIGGRWVKYHISADTTTTYNASKKLPKKLSRNSNE